MAEKGKTRRLGEVLVEEGIISPEQLAEALEKQRGSSGSLGATLVSLGYLTDDALYHFLAMQHGLEVADVSQVTVPPDLLKVCSEASARRLMVFPIARLSATKIRVATASPENPALLHLDYDLVVPSGTEFEIVLCREAELLALIDRHYKAGGATAAPGTAKGMEETLKDLENEQENDLLQALAAGEGDVEVVKRIGEEEDKEDVGVLGEEGPVIKMCNFILDDGVAKGASDIHINMWEKKIVLRYRVDGVLKEFPAPPNKYKKAIASRYKIMARLDPMERRKPQDGRIKYKFRGRSVDLRVSSLPSIWGENIVMRIIDQGTRKLDLKDMNFTDEQLKIFEDAYNAPYGMILVTGPTGSGKTTTLYSVLTAINDPVMNIMTAEDPVEYRLPHIIQSQVNPVQGLTFAVVLKSFLRQDPDVIMVGEIRDKETADIGVKAALTGHLVISTLHTNDAPATIIRLVDMGIDPMYVGTAVLVVCAQKLLRRNCKDCSEPYTPTPEELKEAGITAESLAGAKIMKGKGCPTCNGTGFKGRVAIHEVLKVSAVIRKAIFDKKDLNAMKRICIDNGMKSLRVIALQDWKKGLTTLEEVLAETAPDKV
jgi:type IV pilus assembly protein PilB